MGRPAGVADADVTVEIDGAGFLLHFRYASDSAHAPDFTIQYGNTCRIVAAILQTAQTFDQDGNDIALSNCAYDSAHSVISLF
jgi:hypothetical protein